jgi:hypothetical protein
MTSHDSLRLPLNRKERYYTGTVLPMIVASDNFAHLHRLLNLCSLQDISVGESDLSALHFLTEYSFADSVFSDQDKTDFEHRPQIADSPDVLISGPDWLLVIEAKMFTKPTAGALMHQVNRQAELVSYWTVRLGLHQSRVAHRLLLPKAFSTTLTEAELPTPVVTWEDVAEAYNDVAPPYWLNVLKTALQNYANLIPPPSTWGTYCDAYLSGSALRELFDAGDKTYTWMGRDQGIDGDLIADDIASGGWKSRKYEVRKNALDGHLNWFPIETFIERVRRLTEQ